MRTCVAKEKVIDQGNVQPAAWNMGRILPPERAVDLNCNSSSAYVALPQVCGFISHPNMWGELFVSKNHNGTHRASKASAIEARYVPENIASTC